MTSKSSDEKLMRTNVGKGPSIIKHPLRGEVLGWFIYKDRRVVPRCIFLHPDSSISSLGQLISP